MSGGFVVRASVGLRGGQSSSPDMGGCRPSPANDSSQHHASQRVILDSSVIIAKTMISGGSRPLFFSEVVCVCVCVRALGIGTPDSQLGAGAQQESEAGGLERGGASGGVCGRGRPSPAAGAVRDSRTD